MKQKISYSSIVSGLSIAYFVAFVAIFVLFWVFINKPYDNVFFWILVGLFCLGILWIFCSIPYSVDLDDDYVGEKSTFSNRKYRYNDIASAKVADKDAYDAADRRIHFHGKYKYPVLITLKNGEQYIIGSENPEKLVEDINNRIA
ncbi:MAG: hypothetical protein J1E78_01640 [Muribaculaceae bacterium]|nr:hypothetical protein [Muribaculaceae bacterium]